MWMKYDRINKQNSRCVRTEVAGTSSPPLSLIIPLHHITDFSCSYDEAGCERLRRVHTPQVAAVYARYVRPQGTQPEKVPRIHCDQQ